MRPITLIIPAAGGSTRFPDDVPKPFIRFEGRMMWENAILSLRDVPTRKHLVIRRQHAIHYYAPQQENLATELVMIDDTRGQAHTLLQALDAPTIANREDDDVLIVNSDAGYSDGTLAAFVVKSRALMEQELAGVALTFAAGVEEERRWSWINSGSGRFIAAAEKCWLGYDVALAGAYYFRSRAALRAALRAACHFAEGEPSLAMAFRFFDGCPFAEYRIHRDGWLDWGTREALDTYLRRNEPMEEF